jgi:hypothetical protein
LISVDAARGAAVCVQWAGEVKKHTKAKLLDVLLHHGPQRWNVPVTRLAQADIVITSYAVRAPFSW